MEVYAIQEQKGMYGSELTFKTLMYKHAWLGQMSRINILNLKDIAFYIPAIHLITLAFIHSQNYLIVYKIRRVSIAKNFKVLMRLG